MSLFSLLKRWLFGGSPAPRPDSQDSFTSGKVTRDPEAERESREQRSEYETSPAVSAPADHQQKEREPQRYPRLVPLRHKKQPVDRISSEQHTVSQRPYPMAVPSIFAPDSWLDLSQDQKLDRLNHWDLPAFQTPEELADWLQISPGQLAWLTNRYTEGGRPIDVKKAHYHYSWKEKKSGGYRLIEAPLPLLKQLQEQVLDEILARVPIHDAAHGFCTGRSVVTNAAPHVGQDVVVKLDLDNFYTRVRYSRVVAIFRSIGYSREASIWLAKLTTSAIPSNLKFPGGHPKLLRLFLPRHLPQGAPTSPAIANLVAYSLDLRLAGLAKSFEASYTRYGDDLTFSGDEDFRASLRLFIPLVRQIIREERFVVHADKKRILRRMSQQSVTGVVVNDKTNISRKEFDRLKATLYNCVHQGPDTQNHNNHPDFRAHLRGRIAFVQQLNQDRGAKLLELYQQIQWPVEA